MRGDINLCSVCHNIGMGISELPRDLPTEGEQSFHKDSYFALFNDQLITLQKCCPPNKNRKLKNTEFLFPNKNQNFTLPYCYPFLPFLRLRSTSLTLGPLRTKRSIRRHRTALVLGNWCTHRPWLMNPKYHLSYKQDCIRKLSPLQFANRKLLSSFFDRNFIQFIQAKQILWTRK